jgi:hypothetical protein
MAGASLMHRGSINGAPHDAGMQAGKWHELPGARDNLRPGGFDLIAPEDASGETADLLAATQQVLGITPNLARALANGPAALRAYLGLAGALRGGS